MINQILEQIISGLITGASYALVGAGLSLIWGTLKMINFAHGEFYMLGGYALFLGISVLGLHPALAALGAVLVVMLISCITEKCLISSLIDKPGWDVSPFVITLGISIVLQNLALKVWGERFRNVPYFDSTIYEVLGIRISGQRLIILALSLIVFAVFMIFLKKTRMGWSLRATAQDRDAATLIGINVKAIYMWTFGLSGALASLAGAMLAPIYSVNPWMGIPLLIKGFVVCVLGGLGSLEGAILSGFALGIAENLSVLFWTSEWKDVMSYSLFIIVLWVRPSGLFGEKEW
jgi:branched-chain amino acid transport system permease protein